MSEQVARPAPAATEVFGEYSPAVTCAAGVILVLAIAVIDRLTGYDLHLGILYLVPITMVTWACGGKWGLGIGVVATHGVGGDLPRRAPLREQLLLLLGCVGAVHDLRHSDLPALAAARSDPRARALAFRAGKARCAGLRGRPAAPGNPARQPRVPRGLRRPQRRGARPPAGARVALRARRRQARAPQDPE